MAQAHKHRRSTLVLALAVGFGPPLALSGCGEGSKAAPSAPENRPLVTAKDSMDYYLKSKAAKKTGRVH